MFKKIIEKFTGKTPVIPNDARTEATRLSQAALMNAVEERRKEDPLVGAKIGAKEVYRRVADVLASDGAAVYGESLLCALGALAGYACQAALRRQAVAEGREAESAFMVIATQNGERYFYGETLNQLLAESQYSVWSVAAGAAQHAGCAELPDIGGIFKHVSEDVGGENFGVPRLPAAHQPRRLPADYLRMLWPAVQPVAELFCRTIEEWPLLFGLAIQEAVYAAEPMGIEPQLALTIVMESAVPMSKINLVVTNFMAEAAKKGHGDAE